MKNITKNKKKAIKNAEAKNPVETTTNTTNPMSDEKNNTSTAGETKESSTKDKSNKSNSEPIITETVGEKIIDPLIQSEPIVPDYAKVQVEGGVNYEPIPEEPIERPTVNFNENQNMPSQDNTIDRPPVKNNDDDKPQATGKQPKPEPTMGNPDLADKTTKEKKDSAKYFAQTIVDGYEALHTVTLSWLEKTDEKLYKMAVKGRIELEVINSELDLGQSNIIKINSIIGDYNKTIREVLTVSPEFKNEILPLLEEELKRRNMGMTTFQRIIAVTVKDLQPKIAKVTQLVTTLNSVLEFQTEIIRQQRLANGEERGSAGRPIIIDADNIQEPSENN